MKKKKATLKAWRACPKACRHKRNCILAKQEATCKTCYFNAGDICTAACKVKREEKIACWFYRPRCEQTERNRDNEQTN